VDAALQPVVNVAKRLQEVVSHLTHRLNELRAVQHSIQESGDDERGARIEKIADSLELALSQLVRQQQQLDRVTGTDTSGRITGEWRPPAPGQTPKKVTGEWKPIVRIKPKKP